MKVAQRSSRSRITITASLFIWELDDVAECSDRGGMAFDDEDVDDDSRLSELSFEQLRRLHEQVIENWTQSGAVGDHAEFNVLHVPQVRAAVVAVYVIVIVVSALGNGLVLVVAVSHVRRSSPSAKSSLQVGSRRRKNGLCGALCIEPMRATWVVPLLPVSLLVPLRPTDPDKIFKPVQMTQTDSQQSSRTAGAVLVSRRVSVLSWQ